MSIGSMSIERKVRVNTHYTRSINLERDSDSVDVLNAYIPTSRAIRTLERLAPALDSGQAPRAWSLIGPYGSGKSSFSVFASDLLSLSNEQLNKIAHKKLAEVAPDLQKSIRAGLTGSKGMLKVLVTGSPEPITRRILEGFQQALNDLHAGKRGKKPLVLNQLDALLKAREQPVSQVMDFVQQLQGALSKSGYSGVVLIIDELGKFLEYEARHYGANDIYLLQALAEHACNGHKCNLLLFVTLHQSFEQYTKGLGENLKNEWSKVQGRFEEVPFIETSEQTLRVVSNAIEHSFTAADKKKVRACVTKAVDQLAEAEALPSALKKREAINLLESCYPLHPVTALALPILCQKVAQNERTLFSYLGSHEDFGLADMIRQLDSVDDWVMPHHLFDYFINNQSAAINDYATHRRWAEVITALERLGDATDVDDAVLKTIGLLNIMGAKAGLKASSAILQLCIGDKAGKALKQLSGKSVITYRKFNGEYRVWQGSDFDLEEALQDSLSQVGEFGLAKELNDHHALQPVVARRYTIRNGTLRYFTPCFVDAKSYKQTDKKAHQPRLIMFVAAAQDDEKIFLEQATKHFSELDILALCKNGSQLREATSEVIALRHIGISRQELNNDPVAKREYQDRLIAAEMAQEAILRQLLDNPEDSGWFHKGKELVLNNKRDFQEQLSEVLEKVYHKAPDLHNELVNRDRPSSQANAARTKLLQAMIHNPGAADLGMDKFPPEKAIYRSILYKTGLHREVEGKMNEWAFKPPEKGKAFYAVWQKIDKFLESTEDVPKSFAELNQELMAPPYGLRAGILPILYMTVYCAEQQELAVYENQQYRPVFTDDMLERFVKRPDEFTVQRFRIVGLRASIYSEYKKLFNDGEEKTIIQLVKPLANLIGGLEEYTLNTKSSELSENARGVRDAFKLSKSPEQLLFEDLPRALGYADSMESEEGSLEGFSHDLTEALKQLKGAYANMRKVMVRGMAQAFHYNEKISLEDLRSRAGGRYRGLEEYTIDVDGLRAFIMRLCKRGGTADEWLDNLLMFLGQKPPSKWQDADRAQAEVKINDFAKRLLDLETLRLHYDKNAKVYSDDFEVILLKALRKGEEPIDEVVAIDQVRLDKLQVPIDTLLQVFNDYSKEGDNELMLALLAEVTHRILVKYRESQYGKQQELVAERKPRRYGRVK